MNYENLERNCFYRIVFPFQWYLGIWTQWYLGIWTSYAQGWGFLFRFFDPGAGVLHWKAVLGVEILMEKLVAQQSAWGRDGSQSNWYLHKYDIIKLFLVLFEVKIRVPLYFVQWSWNLAHGSILRRWFRIQAKKSDTSMFWRRKCHFLKKTVIFAQAFLDRSVTMATP